MCVHTGVHAQGHVCLQGGRGGRTSITQPCLQALVGALFKLALQGVGTLVPSRVISVRRRGFEMSYLTCAH